MPSRAAPKIRVLIDGQDFSDAVFPITVHRAAGGERLDHAVLQADPKKFGPIQDLAGGTNLNQTVEIIGELEARRVQYFKGKLTQETFHVADRSEIVTYAARMEKFHFGDPLDERNDFSVATKKRIRTSLPVVFNPEIDGRVYGNMRVKNTVKLRNGKAHFFCDVESLRTNAARAFQGEPKLPTGDQPDPNLWMLSDIVFYLCWNLNSEESIVQNPSLQEIQKVVDDEADFIRDLHVPYGLYLPQALDHVLLPLGYSWFLEYAVGKKPAIKLFKRGVGTASTAFGLQPFGTAIDTDRTNLAEFNAEFDISSLYNEVQAFGGFLEVESTFHLKPGWDSKYDDLTQLKQGPLSLNRTLPGFLDGPYYDVWRKFVLAESGDYDNQTRGDFAAGPYKFSELNLPPEAAAPRRRRFLPCLTLGPNQQPIGKLHGCHLSYFDKAQNKWREVPGEVSLLHTECGVYFHGDLPPLAIFGGIIPAASGLWDKNLFDLRITATVQFDIRVTATAQKTGDSPLTDRSTLILDMPHRFKWRYVDSNSEFSKDVQSGKKKAIQDDDTDKLGNYCDQIRDSWDMAAMSGPFTVEGIDDFRQPPAYAIGQSVTTINGRNISLNTRSQKARTPAYPQICGLTYHFQSQRTTIQLERFREAPRFLRQAEGVEVESGYSR